MRWKLTCRTNNYPDGDHDVNVERTVHRYWKIEGNIEYLRQELLPVKKFELQSKHAAEQQLLQIIQQVAVGMIQKKTTESLSIHYPKSTIQNGCVIVTKSYLTGRSIMNKLGYKNLYERRLEAGVPQEAVLEPPPPYTTSSRTTSPKHTGSI